MNELIFIIEEDVEGGYIAKSVEYGIFTQGDTIKELKENITDSVKCRFETPELPKIIRLHFVRDEVFSLV